MLDNLFMGKAGFIWWVGIVEDIGDPLGLGRCRCRIIGWHNSDRDKLPTDTLPWAYPITPITNAAIAGIGMSAIGPQINTRIFGFFADGETGQQPIMLGTMQGETTRETYHDVPYGSTPQQPIINRLFGNNIFGREKDCPDGDTKDNTVINTEIPDPRNIKINKSEWKLPLTGFVSSAYGERTNRGHHGVDIAVAGFYQQTDAGAPHLRGRMKGRTGLPVMAAAAGEVVYIWTADRGQGNAYTTYDKNGSGSRSYGNAIAIRHNLSTGTFLTIYAHLGENQDPAKDAPGAGIQVKVSDKVSTGQIIGTVGRSHVRDVLTHLHFEIRLGDSLPRSNTHINPGRIFPQLSQRHHTFINWANAQNVYSEKPEFKLANAPIISGEGPTG